MSKKERLRSEISIHQAQRNEIIDEVIDLRYNQLLPRYNVVMFLCEKYTIGTNTAYSIIREAEEVITHQYDNTARKEAFTTAVARFEAIMRLAIENKKFDIAYKCNVEIGKLYGLYAEHLAQFARAMPNAINIEVIKSSGLDYKSLGLDFDDFTTDEEEKEE